MARYYAETQDGKVKMVVAQDLTGVYVGGLARDGRIVSKRLYLPVRMWVKLPEWTWPKEVETTSEEYLEAKRRCERGSMCMTVPTEIREWPGTAIDAIRGVIRQAGSAVVFYDS